MLSPTKHLHPDKTVVCVATILLKRLKTKRVESFDDLLALARKRVRGANILFLPALNLLFILGLVEYRPKTDSFEYTGRNEAI